MGGNTMSDTVDKPFEEGFLCLDGNWRFTFANQVTLNYLKRKSEELHGKVIWQEYPALIGTELESGIRSVMEKRMVKQIEIEGFVRGRWFHLIVIPTRDGIGVHWKDVTDEKQEHENLAANEERLRLLLETYAQSFWEADSNGIIKTVSSTWRGDIERDKIDELFGGLINAIHPDDQEFVRRKWHQAVADGVNYNEEVRLLSPEGEWRWINAMAVPIRKQTGEIAKWVGMNIDITDRKRFENDLVESERRFRALTMATSELVYQFNSNCSEMTVLSSSGFLRIEQNPNRSWLNNYVPPEDHERLITAINHSIQTKSILEMEHKTYLSDGSVGWVYSRAVPLFDNKGVVSKWFGVANNITERKQIEQNLLYNREHLEMLVEKLKQADENRNYFINTLSHELRNPLAAISMGLTILKDADKDSRQAEIAYGIMERQTEQMTRLVDDLLDVTRITQNKIILKKERVDLNDVVYHIVTDFQPLFSEKGVRLDLELNLDTVFIDADPARLSQVIGNLLHNAAKFTDTGDRVKVSVCFEKENKEEIVITVQDTGSGIDPTIQAQLFEPFVQADYSLAHSLGGLGLGLAIVKGMVELHGGSVRVYSEGIGKGTQFVIRLPLRKDEDRKEGEAKTEAAEKKPYYLRILIIEDIPDLADIMSELLFHLGHEVIIALNGPDGIKKAGSYHPDVLISDIGLPEMSGYEVAEVIRNDEKLENIYLIALSGYAQPEDLDRSRKSGFRKHLAKPVSLENLKSALDEAYHFISNNWMESDREALQDGTE